MFAKRKKEMELLRKSLENLENSQNNTGLMIDSFRKMIEKGYGKGIKENQSELILLNPEERDDIVTEEDKKRAAYALNLCTVSVSQIIDYNDENILEQEYETILNNLNLEHMPKDEALLNVLKQLLDTVTFFRIQEGDKKFVEKEYQNKMKDAIWSGIPNFGLIVAGGNPVTVAISLASQVGIGYMNYRKAKSQLELEKEQKEWQLQRAAIEQLNGLRRELFDASWRLADRYEFPDEYRLTERQITQYNRILMDCDEFRKYERLEAVKDYFVAYPPFWYYFGHTANEIAFDAKRRATILEGMSEMSSDEWKQEMGVYQKYKCLAMSYFDTYMQSNKYALLREDPITSACALEYIDLLDIKKDKKKIKKLLDIAEKMSGGAYDIMQLCAISYLQIDEVHSAIKLLRYLVNEGYNALTNAQLLSSIYVGAYIAEADEDYATEYRMLQRSVDAELLFPFPKSKNDIENLEKDFIEKQRKILTQHYGYVIVTYMEKCATTFYRVLPVPDENKVYPDTFFSDEEKYREERIRQYTAIFNNKNKVMDYISRLVDSDFLLGYLDVFNEMLAGIESILPFEQERKDKVVWQLVDCIEEKITSKKKLFNGLQSVLNEDQKVIEIEKVEDVFELSFNSFTEDFVRNLFCELNEHIEEIKDMYSFSKDETLLREFCIKQNIQEFKMLKDGTDWNYGSENKIYFSGELFGGSAEERVKLNKLTRRMEEYVVQRKDVVCKENAQEIVLSTKWNSETRGEFSKYFSRGKKRYYNDASESRLRLKIFAVLQKGNMDLVFTTDGIILDRNFLISKPDPTIIDYGEIEIDGDVLKIGGEKYKNKKVGMLALYDMFQGLNEIKRGALDIGLEGIPIDTPKKKSWFGSKRIEEK